MPRKTVAWQIEGNQLIRLPDDVPDYERHLEDWVEQDPAIVDTDLLLIGRQLPTDFGTVIDLLGLNREGDVVVIELKRDQTLRDSVAQLLEYAAWVSRLSYERVLDIGQAHYGGKKALAEKFEERFETELPDTLNQAQRMILVAPQITDATRTVVEYLAETYGVSINAMSLSLFPIEGRQVLVREAVLSETEEGKASSSKKRSTPTIDEILRRADENGVGPIAEYFWSLRGNFLAPVRNVNGWAYQRRIGKRYLTIFSVAPTAETKPNAVWIQVRVENIALAAKRDEGEVRNELESLIADVGEREMLNWEGWLALSVSTVERARSFVRRLSELTGLSTEEPVEPEDA